MATGRRPTTRRTGCSSDERPRTGVRRCRPTTGRPSLTGAEILANARALAERIRARDLAARYDELRNLPADIVADIRMNMPKIWGGPEMTAIEQRPMAGPSPR